MARSCRFTSPYSREIYLDGKPFIQIHRHVDKNSNGPRPVDVDTVSRELVSLLCGQRKKSSLAGARGVAGIFDFFKRKPKKRHSMSKRIYLEPSKGGRLVSKLSGSRRRRRRR